MPHVLEDTMWYFYSSANIVIGHMLCKIKKKKMEMERKKGNEGNCKVSQKKPFCGLKRCPKVHISPNQRSIQFRTLRWDEKFWHLISGFETRPRKKFLQSRASRRDRDLLSSLSGIETRTRIPLIWSRFSRWDREFWNLPSFPEIGLERPHYFACNFWEAWLLLFWRPWI